MEILAEARRALWRLSKAPAYTVAAVVSLALAIGANSAIFSAVHAVILRPLAIEDPQRLVTCWETNVQQNLAIVEVSYPNFRDWQSQNRTFTQLAAMGSSNYDGVLEGRGDPTSTPFTAVSASFFDVLAAQPLLGRTLRPDDDRPGAERVAVLSHGLWQRRFASDPAVVGQVMLLDKRPHTVVGVMPRDFEYPRAAEFWIPLVPVLVDVGAQWKTDVLENRELGLLYVLGRLKPDTSPALAARDLEQVTAQRWRAAPIKRPEGAGVAVSPFLDQFFGPVRKVLLWLSLAVGLVLLIGCANVSGLMLTRATERRRADAVRLALGARRRRLVWPWVLEAGWLVLFGALAGIAGAYWLTRVIVVLAPADIAHVADIRIDWSVIAFTLGVCALATLVCALAPAWRSGTADVATALAEAARSTAGVARQRGRKALVVVEIALAVSLLVASGLVLRSFTKLRQLDLGYDPAHVLALDVDPRVEGVERRTFYRELLARIETLPQVEAAGAVFMRPLALGPIGLETSVVLEGQTEKSAAAARNPYLNYESATPGYFRAMRMPLVRGRLFDAHDDATAPKVAVVGESTARRLWPGQDALGRQISTPMLSSEGIRLVRHTVVGVVKDARYRGLDDPRLDFYEASDQALPENVARQIMVRTSDNPLSVAAAVQAQARALEPRAMVGGITTMEAIVGRALAPWRFAMWMFTLFSLLAFVLAIGGLFSLVGLNVALRSREFAVRMALGAQTGDISRRVLLEAGRPALVGITLGLMAAGIGTRWLVSLLFEVRPLDPMTYAGVIAIVLAAVGAASLLPARRASRLDPMTVLREE